VESAHPQSYRRVSLPIDSSAGAPTPPATLTYPAPLSPVDREAYETMHRDAVWFPSAIRWCAFRGPKAASALNGLVTNDVEALPVGQGQNALALTAKGRLVADMLVARTESDEFLLAMLPDALTAWMALVRKYVNPRLATITDESAERSTWMVFGPQAARAVAELGGGAHTVEDLANVMVSGLGAWPVWKHDHWNIGPATVRLIRTPMLHALPGFLIIADARDAALVGDLVARSGRPIANRPVFNVARIEGGRPMLGVDMDESTIPQEANLDALNAISFTKGCYTGQEVVARVHFRGHVNRHLRGLEAASPIPQGARLLDADGRDVGDVRSTAESPRRGAIALAMVRREVVPGATLFAQTPEGPLTTRLVALPFPA